jgi:phytoene synthase
VPDTDPFTAARAICRRHARSFYFSSFFLPKPKRDAAYAVYAFCRLLDDATDEASDGPASEATIARFRAVLDDVYTGQMIDTRDSESSLALRAFAITVKKDDIPRAYFEDVADGCRMDLTVTRYQTWDDLRVYCYRVAGVVGLVMCRVFQLTDKSAEEQAVLMGEAMQLTNILRDVGEDFARGRIYLPAEDMNRFNVTESDLAAGNVDDRFRALMRFEIARARQLFRDGAAGLIALPDDGSRFTAAAMGVIYAGILSAIERQDYNVFSRRARLSTTQKLFRLVKVRRLARRRAGEPVADVWG